MILSLLFAFYRTKEETKKIKVIGASIILGMLGSAVSAYIRYLPNFINRTSLNFWSILPLVISLAFLIILLAFGRNFRKKDNKIYENILSVLVMAYTFFTMFYYMPVVLLYPQAMVHYGEPVLSTEVLFRVMGLVLGIIIVILSGLGIYKVTKKMEDQSIQNFVMIALLIRGISQVTVIIQRMYSLRIIPRNEYVFDFIATVINNDKYIVFVIFLVMAFIPFLVWKSNIKITQKYSNPAQLRKIKANMRNSRRWAWFVIITMITNVILMTAVSIYINREIPLSPPEDYILEEGVVKVPIKSLEDGHLHRFAYEAKDGNEMRFIAIEKSPNSYAVCLDACDICGPSGYFERKEEIVCKLCDVVMNRATIGFPGGCNPVPVPFAVHEGDLLVQRSDLELESSRFK